VFTTWTASEGWSPTAYVGAELTALIFKAAAAHGLPAIARGRARAGVGEVRLAGGGLLLVDGLGVPAADGGRTEAGSAAG
jgi:hypothetical protein